MRLFFMKTERLHIFMQKTRMYIETWLINQFWIKILLLRPLSLRSAILGKVHQGQKSSEKKVYPRFNVQLDRADRADHGYHFIVFLW